MRLDIKSTKLNEPDVMLDVKSAEQKKLSASSDLTNQRAPVSVEDVYPVSNECNVDLNCLRHIRRVWD